MTGPLRRQAEIEHAVRSLRREWTYWQALAEAGTLEKHTTQIRGIVGLLGAGLDGIGGQSDPYERVLDLHHVWDFFRGKLVLRLVEPIRPFLDAADELAWAAYRPAVAAAGRYGERLKEPPLVFLDRGAVPFAAARGSSYRDLLPRGVRTRSGATATSVLPFPVIGVPWYLAGHLPGVLLVAHEVGHHIEDDCGLTAELPQCLSDAGLPPDRSAVWTPWLGEAFADVVASVVCGSAYGDVLADSLAGAPADGAGAEKYPPPPARVALCRAAVSAAGLPAGDSPPSDADGTGPAVTEASAVAHAMVVRRYARLGERTLAAILSHPDTARARIGADGLLAGLSSGLAEVRAVLSAAAFAFLSDPQRYDARGVESRVIAEVLALRPKGPRGLAMEDRPARAARDAAAADALLRALG